MIERTERTYGPESTDRLDEAAGTGADGARAALETFYHALNHRDADAMRAVWAADPLAQLDNPVGGIIRGGDRAAALYERMFAGPVRLSVTLTDIVEYRGDGHAVFAGREVGSYTVADGPAVALQIRTTRYFRLDETGWRQYHHHGSIDDAQALADYQAALRG